MIDDKLLRETADRQAIAELIYRYCRSVDRIDPELGYTIWHDNSYADYGENIYQGTGPGVIDHICAQHKHALDHSHQVTNITIELDGDKAGSEAYVNAAIRVERDDKILQIGFWGRYLDQWSRHDGRWGIDRRVTLCDFDEIREVTPLGQAALDSRDRSDPSYDILKTR